jgi:hypothetical protein
MSQKKVVTKGVIIKGGFLCIIDLFCVVQLEGTLRQRILSFTDWKAFWKLVCLSDGLFQFLKPPCPPFFSSFHLDTPSGYVLGSCSMYSGMGTKFMNF